MKKLILTLFLVSASLVSFAQSTVKTIRVATPGTLITENIPRGTQVVVLSTNVVYTAALGIASGTGDFADFAAAIAGNALITLVDTNVYTAVQEEELASDDATYTKVLTSSLVGENAGDAGTLAANEIVKVSVNGILLSKGTYSVTYAPIGKTNTVAIFASLYKWDVVKIAYDTKD
jgi:hypothetical protein